MKDTLKPQIEKIIVKCDKGIHVCSVSWSPPYMYNTCVLL